jgi:NADPH:quinone reductase-like Zn-dependent oxidoreductase
MSSDAVTAETPTTMRAVVLDAPGPPEALQLRDRPVPVPQPGQVLIKVRAFGLNQSERHLRRGAATAATFPIVPGIEAVGIVEACPSAVLRVGTKVATMMGGMGRLFDGGYAEYVRARDSGDPFQSDLDWATWAPCPRCCRRRTARRRSVSTPSGTRRSW